MLFLFPALLCLLLLCFLQPAGLAKKEGRAAPAWAGPAVMLLPGRCCGRELRQLAGRGHDVPADGSVMPTRQLEFLAMSTTQEKTRRGGPLGLAGLLEAKNTGRPVTAALRVAPVAALDARLVAQRRALCQEVRELTGQIRLRLLQMRGLAESAELDEAGLKLLELTAAVNRVDFSETSSAGWSGTAARPGHCVVLAGAQVTEKRAAVSPAGYADAKCAAAGDRMDDAGELEGRAAA
jgi:hypothetical protein